MDKKQFVLHINTHATHGGAAQVAFNIHQALSKQNFLSKFASSSIVNKKDFLHIPKRTFASPQNAWEKIIFPLCNKTGSLIGKIKGFGKITNLLFNIARPIYTINKIRGIDNFCAYPGTLDFFNKLEQFPDIIHCHNLHGKYFDLQILPYLSKKAKIILTLHDEWMFTGNCACTISCTKWKNQHCDQCPKLKANNSLSTKFTKHNLAQKHNIFLKSNLHIVTPSQWLMNKVKQSILNQAASYHVIPNGINTDIFTPEDKQLARTRCNLPQNAHILLFVAHQAKSNEFKDYQTLEKAISHICQQKQSLGAKKKLKKPLLLVCIGEKSKSLKFTNGTIQFVEYIHNQDILTKYYQAADILVHATKSDNFPTTIIEAFACGLPVIGTNTGGIPEQIDDYTKTPQESNGLLYKPKNHIDLANKILFLLNSPIIRQCMSLNARKKAAKTFNLQDQVTKYINLYEQIQC